MSEYHQINPKDPANPKPSEQTTLVDILARSPKLAQIVNKVDQLAKLNSSILKKLDPDLSRYCRVANCRDGILILTTDNPSAGHLLRFAKMDLLDNLRQDPAFCHLKSIQTLVRPVEPKFKATESASRTKPRLNDKLGQNKGKTMEKEGSQGKLESTHPFSPKISSENCNTINNLASKLSSSNLKQALLKLGSRLDPKIDAN